MSILDTIVYEGTKRYYIQDLTKKDFMLENTIPYKIVLLDKTIEEHAWINMIAEVAYLLIETFPKDLQELYDFQCSWSKSQIFANTEKTNFKPVKAGVFINCNHTAIHSCWLIQELLDFFGVDKKDVYFLIHRAPSAEPVEAREHFASNFKIKFREYLSSEYAKTDTEINDVFSMIDEKLNPMLAKASRSYNNFYLFDDYLYADSYAKKVSTRLKQTMTLKERTPLIEVLDMIVKYYKEEHKKAKKA
jgi:hypothetical protein